jgi:hypothetical protein
MKLFLVLFLFQTTNLQFNLADSCGFIVRGKNLNLTANIGTSILAPTVQFLLDGSPIGTLLTAAPFKLNSYDSSSIMDGCHKLSAIVTDINGNSNEVDISISVKN